MLFNLINPEIAAGHPNYVRNYHLLTLLKSMSVWASAAGAAVLWLLVCLLVIRSKKRSHLNTLRLRTNRACQSVSARARSILARKINFGDYVR